MESGTFIFAIALIVNFQNVFGQSRLDPLVDTKLGLIRGISASDGDHSMFLGIPYAEIDRSNPFGTANPYPKFEEVFEAYDDSAKCPQKDRNNLLTGTFDCLHLNVYVPRKANSHNKVPVMVFIHGGFFSRGSAGSNNWNPRYIVSHDVLVVTINYRLGPYGFMCLDIPEVPGNQGLKDQVLALNWVKDNIEAFGGDSRKITVFGQSAGGHSVDFHLLYGDEKLFNNAIIQSGSSLASTVFVEPDKSALNKISSYLGVVTDSQTEALKFLTDVDPMLVIDAVVNLGLEFKPCVEKEFDDVQAFITKSWVNVQQPKVRGKPILIGFNDLERMSIFDDNPEDYVGKNVFRDYLEQIFDGDETELSEMERAIRHFYIGDENISEDLRKALINFDSDFTYVHPIQRSIEKYIENGAKNVYQYMFAYVGERNRYSGNSNRTADGAGHAAELLYLFDSQRLADLDVTSDDQLMINWMTTMWTNFAKYGDPTPETSDLLPVKWTPLSNENHYYMKIDSELTIGSRPLHRRMSFWNLFFMLYGKLQKFYVPAE